MFARVMTVAALAVLGVAGPATAQRGMMGQMSDSTPSMGMAHGMMMGGMMGQGMMGQGMMGGGMMQMMGQGMGMMATGGPGPMTLLRLREPLELTDEQVTRLEEIQSGFAEQARTRMSAAMASHQEAGRALEGDSPDLEAYQRGLQGAANIMVIMHVTMAQAGIDAREVLTPEQRERLREEGDRLMDEMMGAWGWGGMMRNRR